MTHMETATAHPHSSLCQLPNSGLLCSAPWAAVGCQNGAADGGRRLHSSLPPAIAPPHPQGDSFPRTVPSRCCSLCPSRKNICFQRWDGRLVCLPHRSQPRWRAEQGLADQANPFLPGLAGSRPSSLAAWRTRLPYLHVEGLGDVSVHVINE